MNKNVVKSKYRKCMNAPAYAKTLEEYELEEIISFIAQNKKKLENQGYSKYESYNRNLCRPHLDHLPYDKRVTILEKGKEDPKGRPYLAVGWELMTQEMVRLGLISNESHDKTELDFLPNLKVYDNQIELFKSYIMDNNRRITDKQNQSEIQQLISPSEITCMLHLLGAFKHFSKAQRNSEAFISKVVALVNGGRPLKYKSAAQYYIEHVENGTLTNYRAYKKARSILKGKNIPFTQD